MHKYPIFEEKKLNVLKFTKNGKLMFICFLFLFCFYNIFPAILFFAALVVFKNLNFHVNLMM